MVKVILRSVKVLDSASGATQWQEFEEERELTVYCFDEVDIPSFLPRILFDPELLLLKCGRDAFFILIYCFFFVWQWAKAVENLKDKHELTLHGLTCDSA